MLFLVMILLMSFGFVIKTNSAHKAHHPQQELQVMSC
jgi:hypothetical protein